MSRGGALAGKGGPRGGILRMLSREAAVPVATLAFAAAYYADTWQLPVQSRVFPYFTFILLAALTVALLAKEVVIVRQGGGPAEEGRDWRALSNTALVLLTAALYGALIHFTGFIVASAIYLVGAMICFGVDWRRATIISLVFTASLYVFFAMLFRVGI